MRFVVVVLFCGFILTGCATSTSTATARASGRNSTGLKSDANISKGSARPDEELFGRVVSVNPVLRFAVMDFPIGKMPVLEKRLNVYRNGQKVGEVKVTGPMRETTIAGDIMAGEAQVGDEAREN